MTKILVIDDSAFMRKYVRELLEEVGFSVEEYVPHSALEALERIRVSAPDLILSDFNMPDVDGQSVARMARKANPSLPVVILTAVRDPEREADLKKQGVTLILHKPIEGEDLVRAVLGILKS